MRIGYCLAVAAAAHGFGAAAALGLFTPTARTESPLPVEVAIAALSAVNASTSHDSPPRLTTATIPLRSARTPRLSDEALDTAAADRVHSSTPPTAGDRPAPRGEEPTSDGARVGGDDSPSGPNADVVGGAAGAAASRSGTSSGGPVGRLRDDDALYDQLVIRVHAHRRYPELARRRDIQGRVRLRLTVAADGRASEITVIGPADPLLAEAAERAVRDAEPLPRIHDPREIEVDFHLVDP